MKDDDELLTDNADLTKRVEGPPEGAFSMNQLEVIFGIPTFVTREQLNRLHALIDEIVDHPSNTPVEGLHWPASSGSRPNFSRRDASFLGVTASSTAVTGEPTFDEDVYQITCFARGFATVKERARTLQRRATQKEIAERAKEGWYPVPHLSDTVAILLRSNNYQVRLTSEGMALLRASAVPPRDLEQHSGFFFTSAVHPETGRIDLWVGPWGGPPDWVFTTKRRHLLWQLPPGSYGTSKQD